MNEFTHHYLSHLNKVAFVSTEEVRPQEKPKPGLLLKALQGAVAGGLVGATGGATLGAMAGRRAVTNMQDRQLPFGRDLILPSQRAELDHQVDGGTVFGGGVGAAGGALAGGLIGAVANPLFNR
jgi:outer membrane lipoprotein SlyB